MKITLDELNYIAALSKLKFTVEELEHLQTDFSTILDHFKVINDIDFNGLNLNFPKEGSSVLRKDVATVFEDKNALFQNAFKLRETYLEVPKVLD